MKRNLPSVAIFVFALFLGVLPAYGQTDNRQPQTLLQMFGVKSKPARLSESVLVIVDAQREYVDGRLPLEGINASLKEASLLLERARKSGVPVIHVVHKGKPGAPLFNPDGPYVQIVAPLSPKPGETVIEKRLPNAFTGTKLDEQLTRLGRKNLVVIGYMTHMCVNSTVRAAQDRGYRTTVVAKATATRPLPAAEGGEIPAQMVQNASLAALADLFATVVQGADEIPE